MHIRHGTKIRRRSSMLYGRHKGRVAAVRKRQASSSIDSPHCKSLGHFLYS
jgi:hypothetical protein